MDGETEAWYRKGSGTQGVQVVQGREEDRGAEVMLGSRIWLSQNSVVSFSVDVLVCLALWYPVIHVPG